MPLFFVHTERPFLTLLIDFTLRPLQEVRISEKALARAHNFILHFPNTGINFTSLFNGLLFTSFAVAVLVTRYSFCANDMVGTDLLMNHSQLKAFLRGQGSNSDGFHHQPRYSSLRSTFGLSVHRSIADMRMELE